MNLHSLIIDDFLDDFARWRAWFDTAKFSDVVSEVDGVTYPNICSELPQELHAEIVTKLALVANLTKVNLLFARLSPAGVRPPHWAHNDASMGRWSMMLYMNSVEHFADEMEYHGTALLRHVKGEPDAETWRQDTNLAYRWRHTLHCPMVSNRAFVFPAAQWHAALPIGGFGSTPTDGRLVVTAFFE